MGMGSLLLKMIRAVQFFLLCVVFKDINADPRPNPLDTVNVHLHLGDLEEAAAAKEKEGQDYGYHPCAAPPCSVDNGDSINTGDNCKDVICTGKRSAINIKCCGNDYAAKKEGEKGSDYSDADSAKPEADDSPKESEDGANAESEDGANAESEDGANAESEGGAKEESEGGAKEESEDGAEAESEGGAKQESEDGAKEESESSGGAGKKGSDYGYHPCAVPPCKGYDGGDSINSGDNCAGVICTGKRSAVNIKCCGDGRRRRMRNRRRNF